MVICLTVCAWVCVCGLLKSVQWCSRAGCKSQYRQVSNIRTCRRCSNYIFILNLTPVFTGLGKDNYKMRREAFKFWDSVRLILETLRYFSSGIPVWGKFFFQWCSSVPCKYLLDCPVVSQCTLGQQVAFSLHHTSQCTLAQGKGAMASLWCKTESLTWDIQTFINAIIISFLLWTSVV